MIDPWISKWVVRGRAHEGRVRPDTTLTRMTDTLHKFQAKRYMGAAWVIPTGIRITPPRKQRQGGSAYALAYTDRAGALYVMLEKKMRRVKTPPEPQGPVWSATPLNRRDSWSLLCAQLKALTGCTWTLEKYQETSRFALRMTAGRVEWRILEATWRLCYPNTWHWDDKGLCTLMME